MMDDQLQTLVDAYLAATAACVEADLKAAQARGALHTALNEAAQRDTAAKAARDALLAHIDGAAA